MRRPSISLEQLVKIGSSLLNRKGLTEFALKDVAHEVGMRLPSLYNYIESREHLLMLIAEDTAKRFYQLLSTASQEGDGTEKIRQVAEAYLNFAWDYPGEYELMQAPTFWCQSSAGPIFASTYWGLEISSGSRDAFLSESTQLFAWLCRYRTTTGLSATSSLGIECSVWFGPTLSGMAGLFGETG